MIFGWNIGLGWIDTMGELICYLVTSVLTFGPLLCQRTRPFLRAAMVATPARLTFRPPHCSGSEA